MSYIDGLASGLDTTSIIQQLMQLERQPQVRATVRQGNFSKKLTAIGEVISKMKAVDTAAKALDHEVDWRPLRATSSNTDAVAVTVGSADTAGTISFTVDRVAQGHVIATDVAASTDDFVAADTFQVTVGGTTHDITVAGGDRTLDSVVSAVNNAKIGVTASAVKVADGQYRLQLSSGSTGASSEFSVAGLVHATAVVQQGQDAQITVGSGAGAYTATSTNNVFDGLLPGVTVTVKKEAADPVTVTSSKDAAAVQNKVKALVDALNAVVSDIAKKTDYDQEAGSKGALLGTSAVTRARQSLVEAVTYAVDGTTLGAASMAGLSIDRAGEFTFDEAKFKAAYDADPAAVAELFVGENGVAGRLSAAVDAATDPLDGTLVTTENSFRDQINQIDKQIEAMEERFVRKEEQLRRQYAAMESAMSQMQSQSNWLSGQLAGLYANLGASEG